MESREEFREWFFRALAEMSQDEKAWAAFSHDLAELLARHALMWRDRHR